MYHPMHKKNRISSVVSTRKAYRQPVLKKLGSVRQLTLKIGSQPDAATMTNDQF